MLVVQEERNKLREVASVLEGKSIVCMVSAGEEE